MQQYVKPLRSGQITIPVALRDKLGIDNDTLLQVKLVSGELRIKPVRVTATARNSVWFKKLYDRFVNVRKEASSYTEQEINAAVDSAVKAVRKSHAQSSV